MVNNRFLNAIRALYDGQCSVYRNIIEEDENGISLQRREKVYENAVCHISYERAKSAEESQSVTEAGQKVNVFFPLEYNIKSGDMIYITQNGVSEKYRLCGRINIYKHHQECQMEIFDESV